MTNVEKIKQMSKDELADLLAQIAEEGNYMFSDYKCSVLCEYQGDCPLEKCQYPLGLKNDILSWLENKEE